MWKKMHFQCNISHFPKLSKKYKMIISLKENDIHAHFKTPISWTSMFKVQSKLDSKFYAAKICLFDTIDKKKVWIPQTDLIRVKNFEEEAEMLGQNDHPNTIKSETLGKNDHPNTIKSEMLGKNDHPNIIKSLDVETKNKYGIAFVMEFLEKDLETYLTEAIRNNQRIPEELIVKVLEGCTNGLFYLTNSQKTMNLNLNLKNIVFVDKKGTIRFSY